LEKGINPNINDPYGDAILFTFARNGNIEMIELYLSKGGNINVIDENNNRNALHYSAFYGKLETAKYLVSIGIDYKAKDIDGKTALDLAIQENKTKILEFLQEIEKK